MNRALKYDVKNILFTGKVSFFIRNNSNIYANKNNNKK